MDPIEIRDLTKVYAGGGALARLRGGEGEGGVVAVDRLNLRVPKGQICGFLGPNGAGKSTTIKMLVGLVRPTEGRAFINGHDARREAVAAREGLGYLPEVVGLYEDMTARQFLRYTGRFFGFSASEITRRSEELLAAVGLEHATARKVRGFSKGMRQRLALAGAMYHDPQVLILDEPLTGLDPVGVVKMRDAIRALGREKTIFLSSHELHAVEALCDRVVIVKEGRVLADAPVSELTRPGRPRYRLDLAAPLPGLDHKLAAEGAVADARALDAAGAAYVLTLEAAGEAPAALEAAVKHGARVAGYARVSESLEEAFMRVAGVRERGGGFLARRDGGGGE